MYERSWNPARAGSRSLGQVAPSPNGFLASPGLAFATDLTAVGMSGFVALGLTKANNGWSTFWWAMTTAAVIKGLHDWKRLG
jgi:hypothetical protein